MRVVHDGVGDAFHEGTFEAAPPQLPTTTIPAPVSSARLGRAKLAEHSVPRCSTPGATFRPFAGFGLFILAHRGPNIQNTCCFCDR